MKKILYISTLSVITFCFLLKTIDFYKKNPSQSKATLKLKHKAIKTEVISKSVEFNLQGRIESLSNIDVYSESSGKIDKILVKQNQKVLKNQKLAKVLDVIDFDVKTDDIDLPELNIDVDEKYVNLNKKNNKKISKKASERYVLSPCSGYVSDVFAESGSSVFVTQMNATKVASIICNEKIVIKTTISSNNAKKISKKSNVLIFNDGSFVKAKVDQIGKIMNENGSIDVEILISKKDVDKFFINEIVPIKILSKEEKMVKIPMNAVLVDRNGKNFIYIVKNEIPEKFEINPIYSDDSNFYVKNIKAEEIIITSSLNFIKPDEKIEYEINS